VKFPTLTKHNAILCNDVLFTRTVPFIYDEKCFIKIFSQEKGWEAKQICSEYHRKKWSVSFVNDLLRKIDKTGSFERNADSGLSEHNGISRVFLN